MCWIGPENRFGVFNGRYVQIDYDGFLIAANDHARERLVLIGINFLMGNKRRDKDKISRPGLRNKLQLLPQRMRARPLMM